jgi:hypothetical protein
LHPGLLSAVPSGLSFVGAILTQGLKALIRCVV